MQLEIDKCMVILQVQVGDKVFFFWGGGWGVGDLLGPKTIKVLQYLCENWSISLLQILGKARLDHGCGHLDTNHLINDLLTRPMQSICHL